MQTYSLITKDVSIEFPGVKALNNVNFSTSSGEIQAVVGANGAGKSTLMKVLSGAETSYTGQIFLDDQPVLLKSPHDMQKLGIQIVHQEVDTMLLQNLSVAENIMLAETVTNMGKKQLINWNSIYSRAYDKLKLLNVHKGIDVKKQVKELTLAQKQMVIIARALMQNMKFLILDEPTAPLSNVETDELFMVMEDLAKNKNVGIIFISHRLPEVFHIGQTITIMRNGEIIRNREDIQSITPKQVIEDMLGRSFGDEFPKLPIEIGDPILEVNGLTARNEEICNISMNVRAGEIVGIAGLVGAGKSELCKTLFGDISRRSGDINLHRKKLRYRKPYQAVASGLALVPEERRKEGILVREPVYSNLSISNLSKYCNKWGIIRNRKEQEQADSMITKLGIKTPSNKSRVATLSGGNQQKVVVGKWLNTNADVFIFDEPTKGVDVGAKQDIFKLIGEIAAQGKGVIYASCEISELLGITDRIYVMYNHTIIKELKTADTTEEEILYIATGGGHDE